MPQSDRATNTYILEGLCEGGGPQGTDLRGGGDLEEGGFGGWSSGCK